MTVSGQISCICLHTNDGHKAIRTKDSVYNTHLNFRSLLSSVEKILIIYAHYTEVSTVVVLREAH